MLLKDIVLRSPELGLLSCPKGNATAAPGLSFSCEGSYNVSALDLEQGVLNFTAVGTSSTLPAAQQPVAASQADVLVMQAQPQLDLDIVAGSCTQTAIKGGWVVVAVENVELNLCA